MIFLIVFGMFTRSGIFPSKIPPGRVVFSNESSTATDHRILQKTLRGLSKGRVFGAGDPAASHQETGLQHRLLKMLRFTGATGSC